MVRCFKKSQIQKWPSPPGAAPSWGCSWMSVLLECTEWQISTGRKRCCNATNSALTHRVGPISQLTSQQVTGRKQLLVCPFLRWRKTLVGWTMSARFLVSFVRTSSSFHSRVYDSIWQYLCWNLMQQVDWRLSHQGMSVRIVPPKNHSQLCQVWHHLMNL